MSAVEEDKDILLIDLLMVGVIAVLHDRQFFNLVGHFMNFH